MRHKEYVAGRQCKVRVVSERGLLEDVGGPTTKRARAAPVEGRPRRADGPREQAAQHFLTEQQPVRLPAAKA